MDLFLVLLVSGWGFRAAIGQDLQTPVNIQLRSGQKGPDPYDDEQAFDEDDQGTCFRNSGVDKWCWISDREELMRTWRFINRIRVEESTSRNKTTAPPIELLKYHIRKKPLGANKVEGKWPGWQLLVKYNTNAQEDDMIYAVVTFPWTPTPDLPKGYFVDDWARGCRSSNPPFILDRPWHP